MVVGKDVKNSRGLSSRVRQWRRKRLARKNGSNESGRYDIDPQEQCHIVLHADANNLNILKSALALTILRKKLVQIHKHKAESFPLRSRDCMDVMEQVRTEANSAYPRLMRELTKKGWQPPLQSMLGRVSIRAEWPIRRPAKDKVEGKDKVEEKDKVVLDLTKE